MIVERYPISEIDRERWTRCHALWNRVWPPKLATMESDEERWLGFHSNAVLTEQKELREIWHLCLSDTGTLLAQSRSFLRKISFVRTGRTETVIALAGVCSDPSRRGKGSGRAVVEDVFARLETELACGVLFQTGVPRFYEKLGARAVPNRFVDSTNEKYPEGTPWWDEHIMVYPANMEWPTGVVDLCGLGY